MSKTNKEILDMIGANATAQYQGIVPAVEGNGENVLRALNDYPVAKNEFIDTLVNKIAVTKFYQGIFKNVLGPLHKGKLGMGEGIEEIFVGLADRKNFGDSSHFTKQTGGTGTSITDDLFGQIKTDVSVDYIKQNFAYVYGATVSEEMLRKAFYSPNGLSSLVDQIVSSIQRKANLDEFTDMKAIIANAAKRAQFNGSTVLKVNQNMAQEVIGANATAQSILVKVRALSDRLEFVSDKYNMAKVKTSTDKSKLVFLTTPEIKAEMDVNALAAAFNVSYAEAQTRIIVVDEMPTTWSKTSETSVVGTGSCGKVYGILIDEDFIQAYDRVVEGAQQVNPVSLSRNIYLHKQGIMASCSFAQAVAIVEKAAV